MVVLNIADFPKINLKIGDFSGETGVKPRFAASSADFLWLLTLRLR